MLPSQSLPRLRLHWLCYGLAPERCSPKIPDSIYPMATVPLVEPLCLVLVTPQDETLVAAWMMAACKPVHGRFDHQLVVTTFPDREGLAEPP